ncbi:MAG: WecB/TagA/CpsF family glycosyltransferase [Pseudobdellovibrionaceae bacterium]|jgi:exopolysaccharide biosynthesis WecB/TagA/CpsF family protein|nr:WecB/TagA/CpsF family glycosyltransferase [Pseudobdellovibrionaceae bacterium]
MQDKAHKVARLLEKTHADSKRWNLGTIESSNEQTICISFLNAHATTFVYENPDFYESLSGADYVLRDGIGVKIALKLFGYDDTENLNGTDLIPKLVNKWKDRSIAIFGANDEALAECKNRLEQQGISSVMSMAHGFHEPDYYLNLIETQKPEVVILCMGMPKQELLAMTIKNRNLCPVVICGGGWADFYSGIKKRAPEWVRKLSLEWLHRLIREPKRLGKRYTFGILYFFYIVAVSKFAITKGK